MQEFAVPAEPDVEDDEQEADPIGADLLLEIIRSIAKTSPARERELGRRARGGDPSARRDLIVAGLPQVASLALMYARRGGVSLDDLLSAGLEGLIRAVDRFDPERGRLSTYAGIWIRKYIYLAFEQRKKQAEREAPPPPLLLGNKVDKLADDFDDDDPDPASDGHDHVERKVLAHADLATLLATLRESPRNERAAYLLDVFWEVDQDEIGRLLGVSDRRVRQLRDAEWKRLDAALDDAA